MQHDELGAVQRSFVEHLGAFAGSLPAEERTLLDQLMALAAVALDTPSDDVQGYLAVPYDVTFFANLINELGTPALDGATGRA